MFNLLTTRGLQTPYVPALEALEKEIEREKKKDRDT